LSFNYHCSLTRYVAPIDDGGISNTFKQLWYWYIHTSIEHCLGMKYRKSWRATHTPIYFCFKDEDDFVWKAGADCGDVSRNRASSLLVSAPFLRSNTFTRGSTNVLSESRARRLISSRPMPNTPFVVGNHTPCRRWIWCWWSPMRTRLGVLPKFSKWYPFFSQTRFPSARQWLSFSWMVPSLALL
jgi:hypothetical protein